MPPRKLRPEQPGVVVITMGLPLADLGDLSPKKRRQRNELRKSVCLVQSSSNTSQFVGPACRMPAGILEHALAVPPAIAWLSQRTCGLHFLHHVFGEPVSPPLKTLRTTSETGKFGRLLIATPAEAIRPTVGVPSRDVLPQSLLRSLAVHSRRPAPIC